MSLFSADRREKMVRVAINKFVSKKLDLTEGEVCRLTENELSDLIAANNNKIQDNPEDEITRLAMVEWNHLAKDEFYGLFKAEEIIIPDRPNLPDTSHIFFIAGACFYFLYALGLITTQVHKWLLDLEKRLSHPNCHINVTKIPPQERLKIITLSNYSETPCRKLQGLKGIGKTHKGMRQLEKKKLGKEKFALKLIKDKLAKQMKKQAHHSNEYV